MDNPGAVEGSIEDLHNAGEFGELHWCPPTRRNFDTTKAGKKVESSGKGIFIPDVK